MDRASRAPSAFACPGAVEVLDSAGASVIAFAGVNARSACSGPSNGSNCVGAAGGPGCRRPDGARVLRIAFGRRKSFPSYRDAAFESAYHRDKGTLGLCLVGRCGLRTVSEVGNRGARESVRPGLCFRNSRTVRGGPVDEVRERFRGAHVCLAGLKKVEGSRGRVNRRRITSCTGRGAKPPAAVLCCSSRTAWRRSGVFAGAACRSRASQSCPARRGAPVTAC